MGIRYDHRGVGGAESRKEGVVGILTWRDGYTWRDKISASRTAGMRPKRHHYALALCILACQLGILTATHKNWCSAPFIWGLGDTPPDIRHITL